MGLRQSSMPHRSLQHEIGKQRPFDVLEQEAYLNLLRTAGQLHAEFDRFYREFGLSHATYNALRILRGHGGEGAPSQTIGKQLVTPVPDVTRLVDRLVEAGLAARARVGSDRRVVLVRITQAGLELLNALDQRVVALHRQQFSHMTPEQVKQLNDLAFLTRQRPELEGGQEPPASGLERH